MGEPSVGTRPPKRPVEDRLDSWKEIAAYLKRDVTTVQRWEKREGMPVHRHLHDRMGRSTPPGRNWTRGPAAGIFAERRRMETMPSRPTLPHQQRCRRHRPLVADGLSSYCCYWP